MRYIYIPRKRGNHNAECPICGRIWSRCQCDGEAQ